MVFEVQCIIGIYADMNIEIDKKWKKLSRWSTEKEADYVACLLASDYERDNPRIDASAFFRVIKVSKKGLHYG